MERLTAGRVLHLEPMQSYRKERKEDKQRFPNRLQQATKLVRKRQAQG
jgi:hypothetical protein